MEREDLLELDARASGETLYRLLCHLGSGTLAIIASDYQETRGIEVPVDKGLDALAHPEVYLSSPYVIYGAPNSEL